MRKQSTRAAAARVVERALDTPNAHRRLKAAKARVNCRLGARQSRTRKRVREQSTRVAACCLLQDRSDERCRHPALCCLRCPGQRLIGRTSDE